MQQTPSLRRARERQPGELWKKVLLSAFFAFPLLFAKVAPVDAATAQEDGAAGAAVAGAEPTALPGARAGQIPLPDVLGGGEVTFGTLSTFRDTIDQIAGGHGPADLITTYNAARDVINVVGARPVTDQSGGASSGTELTFSLDDPADPTTGSGAHAGNDAGTAGSKVRVVTEMGTTAADGDRQIAVGVLGISSTGGSSTPSTPAAADATGGFTQGDAEGHGGSGTSGPGTAREVHRGVVFSSITPDDQPVSEAFPDINDPGSMAIGSMVRIIPVEATWAAWDTAASGYYDDTVDVRFGEMVQFTRVSANVIEVAVGQLDLDDGQPGLQSSLRGTRMAVAAGTVSGVAQLEARWYDVSDAEQAEQYAGIVERGLPTTGWTPSQVDVELGQFSIGSYLTPPALPQPTSPSDPAGYEPGPFSLNLSADLTLKGQIPYRGYVVVEIRPPASEGEAPTVTFSRFAPGVEITGTGVLVVDAFGNQYVEDTAVQMRIPDLDFMPHKGVITIDQEQLAVLDDLLDPTAEAADLSLQEIFPGVLPDELSPTSQLALTQGIETLFDLGVTGERFLVPDDDLRTELQTADLPVLPGTGVELDASVTPDGEPAPGSPPTGDAGADEPRHTEPSDGAAPGAGGAVGAGGSSSGANPSGGAGSPDVVELPASGGAAAGSSHAVAAGEPDPATAVAAGPLERTINELAAEAEASADRDPVPVIEPLLSLGGLGLVDDPSGGSEPTGIDTRDEADDAPGAREAEISAAAGSGAVVGTDPDAASTVLGLDGADRSAHLSWHAGELGRATAPGSHGDPGAAPDEATPADGVTSSHEVMSSDEVVSEAGDPAPDEVTADGGVPDPAAGSGAAADPGWGAAGSEPDPGAAGADAAAAGPGPNGAQAEGGESAVGGDQPGGADSSDESSCLDATAATPGAGTGASSEPDGSQTADEVAAGVADDPAVSDAPSDSTSTAVSEPEQGGSAPKAEAEPALSAPEAADPEVELEPALSAPEAADPEVELEPAAAPEVDSPTSGTEAPELQPESDTAGAGDEDAGTVGSGDSGL